MILNYTEFEFSSNDGTELFARLWKPESNQPKGIILLVHGLGEHSGRYAELALNLTQAEYAVLAFDQRGHGKSMGKRGHTQSYDILLDDIDCLRHESLKRFPNLPYFIYGHSMGGNLVLNYVLRRQPNFSGVLVTGPWLKLAVEPPGLLKAFIGFLSKLWPTLTITGRIELNALSHDSSVVNAYKADPLVHNKITVRLLAAMDQAGRRAMKNAGRFNLPLLLMHGGSDRITSSDATQEFAASVTKDCTLIIWPGLFHEIHNEPEKKEIFTYVINWLEQQS